MTLSTFDWHSESLSAETNVTDSYKTRKGCAAFSKSIPISIAFMEWIKADQGRTLGDTMVGYAR